MRKLLAILAFVAFTAPVLAGGGGSSSKPLDGSYPIVLVHGILGFDDSNGPLGNLLQYWGGMDDYLRSQGATVRTPGVEAINNNHVRATQLKNDLNYWMAANGFSKVHLLGHSQGGLTSRYMTSNLGMKSKVSTLTTLNSVHRGTPTADISLALIPDWLEPSVAVVVNVLGGLFYMTSEADIIAMATSLTTGAMNSFNANTPNASGVKYYSYGSYMTILDLIQHPIMGLLHPITWAGGVFNGQGGTNDGVVPYSSQKWGSFKGKPSYPWTTTGVDHLQATNFEWTGQFWYDVEGYFLKMAKNAKANQ